MPRFSFRVTLIGTGKNKEAAWEDAVINLLEDPGDCPEAEGTPEDMHLDPGKDFWKNEGEEETE